MVYAKFAPLKNKGFIMKKSVTVLSILLMILCLTTTGCKAKQYKINADKIKVTASIFPIFDWTNYLSYPENKTVDPLSLQLLVKNGVDLHSYQPSASDIVQISTSDIFIYVGGESDAWVKDALAASTNPNQVVINLMDVLKDNLKEESNEGIFQENEEEDEEGIAYDEHIWLSVKNAEICCKAISKVLCQVNPDYTELYEKRLDSYLERLELLNVKYRTALNDENLKPIIICDRFPFRYLADDYNLKYYAAFSGCTTDTEASFETLTLLTQKVDEINPKCVFILDGSSDKLAKTVIYNSSHKMLDIKTLNSMQSVTLRDAFNGKTYIKYMEDNLESILKSME